MNPSRLCDANQSQLLIIDIQERLTTAMPEATLQQVLAASGRLLQGAGLLDIPVIRTEQYPKGLGATDPGLLEQFPTSGQRLEKTSFSCCNAKGFCDEVLDGRRRQVVIAGMETHVCVIQTALELKERDYQVFVVEDAVSSRTEENRRNGLERLRSERVIITNSESVLFEWLRDARHEQFRAVSRLVR